MTFTFFSIGILVLSFLVAGFVVWRLFRLEQYDEQRIIDLLVVSLLGSVIGARVLWVALHWNSSNWSIGSLILPNSLQELSSLGAFLGVIATVVIFARVFRWPYLDTLYKIAWGALVMAGGVALVLTIQNIPVDLLSWLPMVSISIAPVFYFVYVTLVGLAAWLLRRCISDRTYGVVLFLLVIPQIPTFALAIILAGVMWYHKKYAQS